MKKFKLQFSFAFLPRSLYATVKKVMLHVCFVIIALALIKNPVARADFDPELAAQLQDSLDRKVQQYELVGASAAVILPNQGAWLGTSGYSVPANSDTIRSDMLFGIGSVTKTFTAAMMLRLADDGVLSLDDSLHQWIPSFAHVDSTITIRQLLQHTSGIFNFTDHSDFPQANFADPTRFWSPEDVLTKLLNPPYFAPGTDWKYSNTNYIIAGMIIRKATGHEISNELHRRFLDPHNLNRTFLGVEDSLRGELVHYWLNPNNDGHSMTRTSIYSLAWTAGAIFATAEDVAKWAILLYSGEFFSQTYMDEMLTFHPSSNYGLGTQYLSYLGQRMWYHTGGIYGFNSVMVYMPDHEASFVVLLNSGQPAAPIVNSALVRAYLNYRPSTRVADSDQVLPGGFALQQNYPNPFNPTTRIKFAVPTSVQVKLVVYDLLGREVALLVDERLNAGQHSVTFDASHLASGVYVYRLQAGEEVHTRKLILVR